MLEKTEQEIAEEMREWITMPNGWRDVAFYEPARPLSLVPEDLGDYDYKSYFEFRYGMGERGAGGPDPDSAEASWTRKQICKLLAEQECSSIGEVGCGSMVRWNALPLDDYTGWDVSRTAIGYARKKFPQGRFVNENILDVDIGQRDAIIAVDILQHIKPEDYERFIAKLFAGARKLVVIKTSRGFAGNYYQFNHDRPIMDGWRCFETKVPDSPYGVFLTYVRQVQPSTAEQAAPETNRLVESGAT